MKIAKVSHVPIQQPMFINGVLSQAWIMFFERLAKGIDVSDFIDELEIAQRSHELPNMALQGQNTLNIEQQLAILPMVNLPSLNMYQLDMVAVPGGEIV